MFSNYAVTVGTGPESVKFDDTVQVVKMEYGPEGAHSLMEEKPATESKQSEQAATSTGILSAIMTHVLRSLNAITTRLPLPDAATQALRVLIVGNPSNMSMNAAQWGGQTAASGAGASGNGAPRVTPANDTVAGSPQIFAFQNSLDVRNFRNRIVT